MPRIPDREEALVRSGCSGSGEDRDGLRLILLAPLHVIPGVDKLAAETVAQLILSHAVEDAQVILRARECKGSGFDPMELVRTLKGQPEDPVRAAMTARVRDAKDELQGG